MGRLTDLFSKRSIDERLLSGKLSFDTGEGKKRAEQLVSPGHRAKCAKALRDLVEDAALDHPSFFNANLRVQRFPIRENAAEILALARDLESLPTVNPRGVILADLLIQDGDSPAYAYPNPDDGAIAEALEQARAALKTG